MGSRPKFCGELGGLDVHARYHAFLVELGFGPSIKTCDMRLGLFWALLERYHAETCTFHFSCGEYVVLPIDWTAILGIRLWFSLSPSC